MRASKKLFPVFSQGIAATVAKIRLTNIRSEFERNLQEGQCLFFIHDEVVTSVPRSSTEKAKAIMLEAIEKSDVLSVKFTGSTTEHGLSWNSK